MLQHLFTLCTIALFATPSIAAVRANEAVKTTAPANQACLNKAAARLNRALDAKLPIDVTMAAKELWLKDVKVCTPKPRKAPRPAIVGGRLPNDRTIKICKNARNGRTICRMPPITGPGVKGGQQAPIFPPNRISLISAFVPDPSNPPIVTQGAGTR